MGDSFWGDVANSVEHGVSINDGDRLIGLLEDGHCPICGRKGRIGLTNNFTFVRGADTREFDDDGTPSSNPVTERLEEEGYHAVACRASSQKYYLGVASPKAVEAYEEWKDGERDRAQFEDVVEELVDLHDPADALAGRYDHGHLIAAIYEELGAESYDTRELIGRTHVTKAHLAAILARIRSLETRERRDYTENDWLISKDFGVVQGDVEWHVPEWVDFNGLRYSDHYRTEIFG